MLRKKEDTLESLGECSKAVSGIINALVFYEDRLSACILKSFALTPDCFQRTQ